MKTINLEQIFDSERIKWLNEGNVILQDMIFRAMREACTQTVDLCAENAEINSKMRDDVDELSMLDEWTVSFVDKQSILKTKSQII